MRRSIVVTGGVLAAAIVGSVATIAVRGGASAPAAPKPPPVTTATVVRTTLTDSVLTAGTLGYTGSFTVSAPGGTSPNEVSQAEQAAAMAQQKVSADEQAISIATNLEGDQGTVDAASAALVSAESTLTQAQTQLSEDQQLGCPPASSSTVTSPGSSSGPSNSATSSTGSLGSRVVPHDATTSAPTVSTGSASGTTTIATQLSGTVNPNGLSTSYAFHYGTSPAMTSSTPAGTAPAGTAAVDVSATIEGLSANTTYLFVLVATNADGTNSGITQSFSTAESSCVAESAVVQTDTQAVTQARDAIATAQLTAGESVATAQQQLAADQVTARYASEALATASSSAVNGDSIVTAIAAPNATVSRGQAVYAVGGHSIPLLYGTTVPSRALFPGVSDGSDVAQLNANLSALGLGSGIGSSSHFSSATETALRAFQASRGLTVSGLLRLGDVVVAPNEIRITNDASALGASLQPGAAILDATSTTRIVTATLNLSNAPTVSVGEPVTITLPSNATTPGTITAIGPVPPSSSSASSGGASPTSQASPSSVDTQLTVTPTHPSATGTEAGVPVQVSLTTQAASNVLAAPISALLALSGGGYGVEVVEPSGAHHLVGVTAGLYSNTLVELRGSGITAGTRVVVSQ
jgi:hypothetical protein